MWMNRATRSIALSIASTSRGRSGTHVINLANLAVKLARAVSSSLLSAVLPAVLSQTPVPATNSHAPLIV